MRVLGTTVDVNRQEIRIERHDPELPGRTDGSLAVLEADGLTASEAVRLLFRRIIAEQALPPELKVPNAETRAAMAEAEEMMRVRLREADPPAA